jgi:hypothetical protein
VSIDLSSILDADHFEKLMPLALGHDQEASACPWVSLTRRTSAYPSRVAQAALLLAGGAMPPSADLVDQLYRCDDCGRCRAQSNLPDPPDLPRTLWEVRAGLVAAKVVSEVAPLVAALSAHGTIYGNLRPAFEHLGPGDAGADILFVPGAAMLFHDVDASTAALRAARSVSCRVDVRFDAVDSGHTARELGLREEAAQIRVRLRELVGTAGYRLVVGGTPKEAFGVAEALTGLAVEVCYAGSFVARSGRSPTRPNGDIGAYDSVIFHPSETLLYRLDGFDEIDRWLAGWLGDAYRPELDAKVSAWPAAIERPAIRVSTSLTMALAEARMAQLLKVSNGTAGRRLILTCDSYSLRALRDVASPDVAVMDLLDFAFGEGRKGGTGV